VADCFCNVVKWYGENTTLLLPVMSLLQVEVEAADCAILCATPTFICSGDTTGNVCSSLILLTLLYTQCGLQAACQITLTHTLDMANF